MTAPVSDAPPVVPPANPRPSTATQKADLALDRLDDLERALAAGGAPVAAADGQLAEKVTALDGDLDALGQALNTLAEKVDTQGTPPAAELPEDVVTERHLQQVSKTLQDMVLAVDGRLREVEKLPTDGPTVDEQVLANLLRRLEAVEQRPVAVAGDVVELQDGTPRGALVKFLDLMRIVDSLGKDKQASPEMGGYGFRSIDAAMDSVGHAMRTVGLIMRSEVISHDETKTVVNGRVWTSVAAKMRYVFVDPMDGSEHAIEMVGEGRDLGDKATSKAVSMALKYGLLQSLCIPFNAPESDGESTPPIEREPQQEPTQRQQRPAQQEQRSEMHAPLPADEPPTPDELGALSEEEQNAQALRAVQAIDALNRVFPADQVPRLQAIEKRCRDLGIGGIVIRGSTVAQHVLGARATLPVPDGGW